MTRQCGLLRFAWGLALPVSIAAGASLAACAREPELARGRITGVPLAPAVPGSGPLFASLPTERTGVRFENPFEWQHPRRHLYRHGFAGGGVCIGDFDADGRPDIFLTGQAGPDRLFRQVAPLVFEDVTAAAGLMGADVWSAGATFADYDGDGALDLFVCSYDAPNRLYHNRGDGTFVDVAAEAGLDFSGASVMAGFADYDGDGDLDVFLVTNRLYPGPGRDEPRTVHDAEGRVMVVPEQAEAYAVQERLIDGEVQKFVVKVGQRDRLYRNEGDGTFTEVAQAAGIAGNDAGLSATWWDYDRDGFPDLYVSNDFWAADCLYHNEGDGTFRDVARTALPHTPWFSMGADFADVDGDGRFDLLAADMSPTTHVMAKIMMGDMGDSRWFLESAEPRQYMRNALYLGTGTGRFMEVAYLAGLDSTDWTWSVKFGDLDADGREDVFFTNGTANHTFDPDFTRELDQLATHMRRAGGSDPDAILDAQWRKFLERGPRAERNLVFKNLGELAFADVTGAWGLGLEGLSFGAALSDLDRDGDLDLVVNNVGGPASVYENGLAAGHRILVRLVGQGRNRFGIGAIVECATDAGTQVRALYPTRGYMSANEPLVHFGLGGSARIARLSVRWPSGHHQTFTDLPAGRLYTIEEPAGAAPPADPDAPASPLFVETSARRGLAGVVQPERPFDDFARQPLLPARLSQLGPGLALGDVNGDGRDDLFLGGPAGRAGRLYIATEDEFRLAPGPWADDADCEDMAVLFFDADSDGDVDLFVASGGVEADEGEALLRDRLYLGDGHGAFVRAPHGSLPDVATSSGAAALADVDGDGDLDLFIGGRTVPGRYPLAPPSRLLANDGGVFRDATAEWAPGFTALGIVTGALFADIDGDGRPDLLVAQEWGPVAFFRNVDGRLIDRTAASGLAERSGWWNGLAAGDLDGDGDLDFVATNAGENTKYHADPERPAVLFYGDFDGGGTASLVEAKAGAEALFPVRGLSCSSGAMPFIRRKLPTFRAFASATLAEIYDPGDLAGALVLRASHLASGTWLADVAQDGTVRFTFRALPRIAQAAPGFGVALADFDADGALDVFFVQNSFAREPETGRWDGGVGQLLAGDGRGRLVPVEPAASGLVITGDAKALALTDVNGDGRPDAFVTQNDGALLLFESTGVPGLSDVDGDVPLAVRLVGPPGNLTGVGARVTVVTGERRTTAEVAAGSGYLGQSGGWLFFGRPAGADSRVLVRWPAGGEHEEIVVAGPVSVTIASAGRAR